MVTINKENALKILEEHYKVAKEQKDAWDFFLNTAEYVRFVQSNSQLAEAVKKLEEQQKQAYEIFHKIDFKAIEELQNNAKAITEIVKRQNISLDPVNNFIKELQAFDEGHILSSIPRAHQLDEYLFGIARALKANGFENIVQQFVDTQKKVKNMYGNFTFSPTLPLRDDAEQELQIKRKTETWGAWEDLPFIARVLFDEINLQKELEAISHKDKLKKWEFINYLGVRGELKQMRGREKNESELVFFKVSEFRKKLDRIQKYLISELLSDSEEKPQRLDFDASSSTLYFAGKAIIISVRAQNDAHELLRTIFKDRTKLWNADEVLNDWRFDIERKTSKRKVYYAGKAVNRIIALKTQIDDFLTVTTKTVAINKRYLGP